MAKEYDYWVRDETTTVYEVKESITEDKMGSVRTVATFYDKDDAEEYVKLKSRHLRVVEE